MAKSEMFVQQGDAIAEMEKLKERHTELDRKRAKCQANLETAQKQLEALKQQAREQYQTDDIAELQKKLADMKAENRRKCDEYRQLLDSITGKLKQVEDQYKQEATR